MARNKEGFDKETSTINGRQTLCDYDGFIEFMYGMAVNKKQFCVEWFENEKYKKMYKENELKLEDIESIIDIKFARSMVKVYDAAKERFDADSIKYDRPCQFLLQGNDIMIDENGKFWVLEINQTPTMFKDNDERIKQLMKDMVKESIDIVMEIRELKLNGTKVNQYTQLKTPKLWRRAYLDYKQGATEIVDSLINSIDAFVQSE